MVRYPNLLPTSVLERRSRRWRLQSWTGVLLLETVLGLAVCIVLRVDNADAGAEAKATIESTVGQINVVSTALAASKSELQSVEQKLAIATEVAGKPDWSIVLSALAWRGQGLVVLTSTQLLAPTVHADTNAEQYRLSIMGTSPTQERLTAFVQSLEETGIFSRVKIVQTQRQKAASGGQKDGAGTDIVGFNIEAWLTDGGGR